MSSREELWKRAVERLVYVATSRAKEIERLHPEHESTGHPAAAHALATAITIAGAAVIRTCRDASDPIAALDVAIEGLQQARDLMVTRREAGRKRVPLT
jgi:hypothetical protein